MYMVIILPIYLPCPVSVETLYSVQCPLRHWIKFECNQTEIDREI